MNWNWQRHHIYLQIVTVLEWCGEDGAVKCVENINQTEISRCRFIFDTMFWSQALLLIGFMRGFLSLDIPQGNQPQQCRYLDNSEFLTCWGSARKKDYTRLKKIIRVDKNMNESTLATSRCKAPCQKVYQSARILRSMSTHIAIQTAKLLERCCGGCSKYNETRIKYPMDNQSEISDMTKKFDITYPILSSRSLSGSKGFYFIPIFKPQSSYYITLKKSEKEMAQDVIICCMGMWPIVVIGVLMSIIAGFFVWLCDTWSNKEHFPRPFGTGLYQGNSGTHLFYRQLGCLASVFFPFFCSPWIKINQPILEYST